MINTFNTNQELNIQSIKFIIQQQGTPIWIYNADTIQSQIQKLHNFDIIRFAQKACSNIHILKIMKKSFVHIDAVSSGEIDRALISGFHTKNDEIVFTADVIDKVTLSKIIDLNITTNVGSLDMLQQIGQSSPGHRIWMRINPGFGNGHSKKTNTGGENSKHGIWNPELALPMIKKYKLKLIGLHMHIGSGVDYNHLKKVCNSMIEQAIKLNQNIKKISAGGGLSIPYKKCDVPVDTNHYFNIWNNTRNVLSKHFQQPIQIEIEPGRFLVGESGILVATVYTIKKIGKKIFTLVDAGFNDLIRPTLYGSYHHISVIPGDNRILNKNKMIKTIIGGPLCEAGDIFTQNSDGELLERLLPEIKIGDYLVFHNTGAYGASMSSHYNSRPLIPEILFQNGKPYIIRRRQTMQDILELETKVKIIQ